MRVVASWLAVSLLVAGCSEDEKDPPRVQCVTADGAVTFPGITSTSPGCGVVNEALVDKLFAVGVTNNARRVPQSKPLLRLRFNDPVDGEVDVVRAVAVPNGSINVDGVVTGNAEWAGVPARDFSVRPAHEVVTEEHNPLGLETVDHGINEVSVAAAYDETHLYMRFRWRDDTRNDRANAWTNTATGWRRRQGPTMSQVDPSIDHSLLRDEPMDASEDSLHVLFNINGAEFEATNGCAGMCHLEHVAPGATNVYNRGGGMAARNPGETADSWVWLATATNPVSRADDRFMDCGGATPDVSCDHTANRAFAADSTELSSYVFPSGGPGKLCTNAPQRAEPDPARLSGAGVPNVADLMFYLGNFWLEVPTADCPTCSSCNASACAACTADPSDTASCSACDQAACTECDSCRTCVQRGPSRRAQDPNASPAHLYLSGSPHIGTRGEEGVLIDGSETFAEGVTLPGSVHVSVAEDATCARCVRARGTYDDVEHWWTVEISRTLAASEARVDVDFTVDQLQQ